MAIKLFQVDAFTEKPFKGNPAAVCILEKEMEYEWMQNLAKEMNLSETAFVLRKGKSFSLRWFTPKVEVNLCGHATLATAHILFENGYLSSSEIATFDTRSGILKAKKDGIWVILDFPIIPVEQIEIPDGLEEALGTKIKFMGESGENYFIEIESEEILKNLYPNFEKLSKYNTQGFIVTARSLSFDFISRFFAPQVGINEDPVTGSAHSSLFPYWQKILQKNNFLALQASERGGILKLSSMNERVLIAGQAVTIFEGVLKI